MVCKVILISFFVLVLIEDVCVVFVLVIFLVWEEGDSYCSF